jgi:hypothetical protein
MITVVLYGRPDCHLCDLAREGLADLRREGHPFRVREIDIEADQDLLRRYLERIPVVEVDGEVVSELSLDPAALLARLDTVHQ